MHAAAITHVQPPRAPCRWSVATQASRYRTTIINSLTQAEQPADGPSCAMGHGNGQSACASRLARDLRTQIFKHSIAAENAIAV